MEGFVVHSESSTRILLRQAVSNGATAKEAAKSVFLNPVQQYNRDLSITAIRVWSKQLAEEKKQKRGKRNEKHESKKRKIDEPDGDYHFTCLEALSATGLRAIRYAKELPLLKWVVANDLSASAVQDIKRNIEYNDLIPKEGEDAKVRANEADAVVYMYQKRSDPSFKFDCVDLDPYGSATPFLDAAVGVIADGGLLCVTCTDMGVLAGHNYPEKAYTHYGGSCANTEYSHEVGLRLVLNAIATTAARYGKYIEPLLTLSIDFYCRTFVRVFTSAKQAKDLPSKTGIVYYCGGCQAHSTQLMGRKSEKVSEKNGQVNATYHIASGPPVGQSCEHCNSRFHLAGPMWMGPLHSKVFCDAMLEDVKTDGQYLATKTRIEGMVTIARNELEDAPFYVTPHRLSSLFNAETPSIATVASALLNAGYRVSRSHAAPGSIKTDAPRQFLYDVVREWIKTHPVKLDRVKEGSPTRRLLQGAQKYDNVDLSRNANLDQALLTSSKDKTKIVLYQENPQANWGPAKAAAKGIVNKSKKSKSTPATSATPAISPTSAPPAGSEVYVAAEEDEA